MISVAIDGPAGAGKSTVARAAAQELGYIYVDTGALYRTIGLHAFRNKVEPSDRIGVPALLPEAEVELRFVDGEQRVFLNGEDVSDLIRSPEVSMAASQVSAIPEVRAFLFDLQKNMARTHDVVMDGRDIGTVVLPEAQVKIFLTATPEIRAKRRFNEMKEKGMAVDFVQILEEVKQRDYNDSHRAIAPLKQAEDAVLLDSSDLTLAQSVEAVLQVVKGKIRDVL